MKKTLIVVDMQNDFIDMALVILQRLKQCKCVKLILFSNVKGE